VTHDTTRELDLLHEATQRLVRTVDGFADDDWARPSGLPGWTRSHVVAHLALNSEGLAGALSGIVDDEQHDDVPMYASDEARDGDIEELSGALPSQLRARLMGGVTQFADAAAAMPADAWSARIERTPGGRTFAAASTIGMRLREVEIHHADLDAGYHHRDWSPEFCGLLLDAMAKRGAGAEPFRVSPTDLDGTWVLGEGGQTVSGTAADLGWWLTGRGDGNGLTSDNGVLPRIEGW
jgi:maleylpyruvate isomerase